jgi:hypothetical protein
MSATTGAKGLAAGVAAEVAGQSAGDHQVAIAIIGAVVTGITVIGSPVVLDLYRRRRGQSRPGEDHSDIANALLARLEDRDQEVTDLRKENDALRREKERRDRDRP